MNEHDEIINLNAEYLDIDELERRLELALGVQGLDSWHGTGGPCPQNNPDNCPWLCGTNCPNLCSADSCVGHCSIVA